MQNCCLVISKNCGLLKYLINTIKTSWQKTAVTVHPQLADYPEKGPSGGCTQVSTLGCLRWPQGIIRLPWQRTIPLPGKPKGIAESVMDHIPGIRVFVREESWETKKARTGQERTIAKTTKGKTQRRHRVYIEYKIGKDQG